MKNYIKKYAIYGSIVIFGIVIKNLFKNFDTYSFGFLVGGIAVLPLWKDYYTNYKQKVSFRYER